MASQLEEPAYELISHFGDIELRHYQPCVQAVTPVLRRSSSNAFRRLAGYIFGGNRSGAEIAMTAPVATTLAGNGAEMAFTMPTQWPFEQLPKPKDHRVSLRPVPGHTAAVLSFGGWATDTRARKMRRRLESRLRELGLCVTDIPVLNQYNPPWTPPFLRRNEISVNVRWPD